ncbi:MAG: hypothetical protein ACI9NN_001018 [Bacteroidia bacterium]|jgi:hypothetical protein
MTLNDFRDRFKFTKDAENHLPLLVVFHARVLKQKSPC